MGRYTGKKCRLVSMFALTGGFFLVEIVVGYVTNSMALVADSFHMLSDIAALVIAFLSVKMAPKSWDKNTYGWARAEVLGALVNAVFLVALCFSITVESLKRFYEPEKIHNPQMILLVGSLGLVVNLLGLCLFHEHGHSHGGGGGAGGAKGGHSHHHHGAHSHLADMADAVDGGSSSDCGDDDVDEHLRRRALDAFPTLNAEEGRAAVAAATGKDAAPAAVSKDERDGDRGAHSASQMNMRGVFLHVLADALGSVVVIISALIMWLANWDGKKYVDPALSLCLVALMLRSVWPLLIESALILLQTVPTHIEVDTLKKKLLENIDGVLAVHEFHVWQLTGDRIIASAHIRCFNLAEYMKVAENIKEFFHNEGIHSTTIQPEFLEYHPGREYLRGEDCILACPKGPANQEEPACQSSKCCQTVNNDTNNGNGNGNGSSARTAQQQQQQSRSAQNTPLSARRQLGGAREDVPPPAYPFTAMRQGHDGRTPQQQQQQQQQQRRQHIFSSPSVHTSTPNRRSASNLEAMFTASGKGNGGRQQQQQDFTAEFDLSNNFSNNNGGGNRPAFNRTNSDSGGRRVLVFGSPTPPPPQSATSSSSARRGASATTSPVRGVAGSSSSHNFTSDFVVNGSRSGNSSFAGDVDPLEDGDDSRETTPMFCSPRSSSRVVRIVSKQSNV